MDDQGKPRVTKAGETDCLGRFREIVSDPLNLLIRRHPLAGAVQDGLVYLHNGHRVPMQGPTAYYDQFSYILVINRGVHEPLEEYVFQELLKILPQAPVMLELGAYWGHYSMWLKQARPQATVYLVEPDASNLAVGVENFRRNGYEGVFLQESVGFGKFGVDAFMRDNAVARLSVLHADIQGYEGEMISESCEGLKGKLIDYLFVSTHSQQMHEAVRNLLVEYRYRIEVSSDFDNETTSFDGLLCASSPEVKPLFDSFRTLGRTQITVARPAEVIESLRDKLPPVGGVGSP
jgi:hypothetical protein